MKKIEPTVKELSEYLDTFYNDMSKDGYSWPTYIAHVTSAYLLPNKSLVSFWLRYTSAPQSLSHVLLTPQNPFYVLQYAETVYTANDVPLAMKNVFAGYQCCRR
jgi:ER membrane protein complex subunit 2